MESMPQVTYLGDQVAYWGPKILAAIVILIITHFVAKAVKWACIRGVGKLPWAKSESGQPGSSLGDSLGTIAYWIIWLIGLMVAVQPLGLSQALEPINALTQEVMVYLPRLIAAALILVVGILVARIVRNIVESVLNALNPDRWLAKLGMCKTAEASPEASAGDLATQAESAGTNGCGKRITRMLGMLVFTLIIIPVAISALQTLGISSIVDPTVAALRLVLDAIPRIFAAAVLLVIALFIAQWVRGLVEQILSSVGLDNALASVGGLNTTTKPSRVAGWLALVAIMLFAAIEAAKLLDFELTAVMLAEVIQLGGHVVFGSLIVVAGVIMGRIVARVVGDTVGESGLPSILKYAVIALAVAIGLRYMGLANEIVNLAFGLILGSAAVACALAFGLGGRETAHQLLQKWFNERQAGKTNRGATSLPESGTDETPRQ